MDRPRSVSGEEAGAACLAGWIGPAGRFYPAPWLHHIRVAAALRATGEGPGEPWNMRDGWAMIRLSGELVILPYRLTQAQLDTVGDMLTAAPKSGFRANLLASLRALREIEMSR